ncbi:SRPBCC family protein [Paenibacillus elgii]|uniref:Polyketide cyclase n=1 Tax=Paenibacillus elgii TaxID=189691 RepID=A0A2T6G8J3_9BACL|nr:SRPBCC family protein [Paenibacillus elgii]MCM3273807.1 SRPBCC family protein [Paenibacillus elgii]PUA40476.1 polyketide cyclase [Paenibacillus elgii]
MPENNAASSSATNADELELSTTRIFDAPRELVFKAWILPEHLSQWWGPKGFTNTFQKFDLRPGGTWEFIMHGPDGTDYRNKCVFVEIVEPERIVLQHVSGPRFQVTATFEDLAGKTRLTFRQRFETAVEFEKVKTYAIEGNEQNMDRLGALLANISA